MDTNEHECRTQNLLYKEEVYCIVGAAMEVANILGHGLLEKPYENALVIELDKRNIPYKQQVKYPVIYKNEVVGEYYADLLVFDSIIVEVKSKASVSAVDHAQVINYLRISGNKLGLIINFNAPKLHWERVIL